jgi:hypothetical protein
MGPWFSQSQCTSMHFCSMQCRTCVASDWSQGNLCYTTHANSTNCTTGLGGQWVGGICQFQWLNSRNSCEVAGYVFESCNDLTSDLNSCDLCAQNSSSCPVTQNNVLACRINNWGQCATQQDCLQAGVCNDWEFQNWQADFCRQNPASDNCTGVCVYNFTVDFWGNPQCQTPLGWSKLGCTNTSITDPTQCTGTWVRRAFTEADCLAHGSGCYERRFWQPTPKNSSSCSSCGGNYRSLYKWTPAKWVQGEMRALEWVPRKFGSINTWNLTINWTKLDDVMNLVVAQMMQKALKSQFLCQYSLTTANIEKIACDCGDVVGSDCFNSTTLVPIGETNLFSGLEVLNEWGKVSVTSFLDSISNSSDSISIIIEAITDLSFLGGVPLGRSRLGAPQGGFLGTGSSTNYNVVYDDSGNVIGQIVGSGMSLSAGGGFGDVQICMTIDPSIPINPWFNISDFGEPRNGDNANITAQFLNATVSNGQICATINSSGTYFPIYRSLTPLPSPSPTPSASVTPSSSSSPSPSKTPSTSSTPTPSPSPSLSPSRTPSHSISPSKTPSPSRTPSQSVGATTGVLASSSGDPANTGLIVAACIIGGMMVLIIVFVVLYLLVAKRDEVVYARAHDN